MAGKRCADNQLTSDNWNQEEEETETVPIGFKRASEAELRRRPIKTAKRSISTISLTGTNQKPPLVPINTNFRAVSTTLSATNQMQSNSKYIRKLCALNESVSKCISEHVKKNACIDLTPIFEDYKKYLKEIEELSDDRMEEEVLSKNEEMKKEVSVPVMEKDMEEENEKVKENGQVSEEEDNASSEEHQPQEEQKEKSLHIEQPADDDDSILALRSRLFYKKQEQFVELGIGKLKVQTLEQGGGVRLLLRNDTSLGQILLNVRLSGNVPVMLQKNSVLFVCVPNPPLDMKSPDTNQDPVTYLLRVKDTHLANELYSSIKNNL